MEGSAGAIEAGEMQSEPKVHLRKDPFLLKHLINLETLKSYEMRVLCWLLDNVTLEMYRI